MNYSNRQYRNQKSANFRRIISLSSYAYNNLIMTYITVSPDYFANPIQLRLPFVRQILFIIRQDYRRNSVKSKYVYLNSPNTNPRLGSLNSTVSISSAIKYIGLYARTKLCRIHFSNSLDSRSSGKVISAIRIALQAHHPDYFYNL